MRVVRGVSAASVLLLLPLVSHCTGHLVCADAAVYCLLHAVCCAVCCLLSICCLLSVACCLAVCCLPAFLSGDAEMLRMLLMVVVVVVLMRLQLLTTEPGCRYYWGPPTLQSQPLGPWCCVRVCMGAE